MLSLLKNLKRGRLSNAVAAGQTDINSDSVDALGFDVVEFSVHFGAIVAGAVTSVKVQGSTDDAAWNDLTSVTKTIAATDDNKICRIEVVRPLQRYLRVVVDRGTQDATVDSIDYLMGNAGLAPVTQDTDVVNGDSFVSPATS